MFHSFSAKINGFEIPQKFTCPFCYKPNPLCITAAEEVKNYLATKKEWAAEIAEGKMFGVLVVKNKTGKIGYLAAFSGNLAHTNKHRFFVPPVFDFLQPKDFFRKEETQISEINKKIFALQNSVEYANAKKLLQNETVTGKEKIAAAKEKFANAKAQRNKKRLENPSAEILAEMISESQFQKAELHRMKKIYEQKIADLLCKIKATEVELETLKTERKTRSIALQRKIFQKFIFLNAYGEERKIFDVFEQYAHCEPPSGAGECAGPKLLQYAYKRKLQPIAMAEFWQGKSPKTEIRHNNYYYPACKQKCEPILNFMLQGLDVEDNPLLKDNHRGSKIEIVYEDEWLIVVNKPAGMLSVPGKNGLTSVAEIMQAKYPDKKIFLAHRLDMATSGLLIVSKDLEVYKNLQNQFKNHQIKKKYIALLDGVVKNDKGKISLPIRLDENERPKQIVDRKFGKEAITFYQVLERRRNQTLVAFYPQTGRTHQLRVHASHINGLNAPICGDSLYGVCGKRLYLHAQSIEFKHPKSGKIICCEKECIF